MRPTAGEIIETKPSETNRKESLLMSRWRLTAIAILLLAPLLLLGGIGLWKIWQSGHWLWLSWALPACWGGAWLLLRKLRRTELPLPEIGSRIHWTPQDHQAAAIITAEQKRIDEATAAQLITTEFYQQLTIDLATKLARHYHPAATDPLGALSVVELLAVCHLVSDDLEAWFQAYVPGSHLITVSQWRMLEHVPSWLNVLSNLGTVATAILDPSKIPRQIAMRGASTPLMGQMKTNLLGAFCRFYQQRVGYYLIELNSGRLRGGSSRYRKMLDQIESEEPVTSEQSPAATAAPQPVTVTIAIVGQVKAGKSSLANCLLDEQHAAVDILPLTRDVTRYELKGTPLADGTTSRLVLLDTAGYSDAGTTAAQKDATREAVRQADLVLLVMAATSPAKQADVTMLKEIHHWFESQHRLKPPPVIGVITKVDALSPVMEWAPPYHWDEPARPKEHSIRDAVKYAAQTLGSGLSATVPVVTYREGHRVYGIEEWLLPTIALHLDEARAVSLVRSLHQGYDKQKLGQVVTQLMRVGLQIKGAIQSNVLGK